MPHAAPPPVVLHHHGSLIAEDLEENDAPTQADTVAAGVDHEGRLDFFYDDNSDYYRPRSCLPPMGSLNITVNAEHAGTSTERP